MGEAALRCRRIDEVGRRYECRAALSIGCFRGATIRHDLVCLDHCIAATYRPWPSQQQKDFFPALRLRIATARPRRTYCLLQHSLSSRKNAGRLLLPGTPVADNGDVPASLVVICRAGAAKSKGLPPMDQRRAKRALITGITGQDGSYLAEFLLAKGYEVHGLIRRSSTFNTDRIDHIYQDPHTPHPKLTLHYGDLTDGSSLREILSKCKPSEIY